MNYPTILVYSSYCSSIHSTRAIRPPSHLPRSCIWMLLVLVVSTHHPQVELQPLEDSDHERNQWDLAEQIMTIRASLVVADADNKMLRLRPFCCLLDTSGQQTCSKPMEDGWWLLAYNRDQRYVKLSWGISMGICVNCR